MSPTITRSPGQYGQYVYEFPFVADGAGSFTVIFDEVGPIGSIQMILTDEGTPAPTDNWDFVLLDRHGRDITNGWGANRDTVNSEAICPMIGSTDGTTTGTVPMSTSGPFTLKVTNAGAGGAGSIFVYAR